MKTNIRSYDRPMMMPGFTRTVKTMGDYRCQYMAFWWLWWKFELFYDL